MRRGRGQVNAPNPASLHRYVIGASDALNALHAGVFPRVQVLNTINTGSGD